jgi:hypothetical protein
LLNLRVNSVNRTDIGCVQEGGKVWALSHYATVLVTKKKDDVGSDVKGKVSIIQ